MKLNQIQIEIGDRVKTYDDDDQRWVRGIVASISEDKKSIDVKREDISEPVKHHESDFGGICKI